MAKNYTTGELFGGAIPSDIKDIFRDKMKKTKEKKEIEKEAERIVSSDAFSGLKNAGFSEKKAFKIMRGY